MDRVFEAIKKTEPFLELVARLRSGKDVDVGGLWGSSGALITAALVEATGRPMLLVVPGVEEADEMIEDLEAFRPGLAKLFPAWETLPTPEDPPDVLLAAQRLSVLSGLAEVRATAPAAPFVVVTSAPGLVQAVVNPRMLAENRLSLAVGQERSPHAVAAWLVEHGFEASAWVDHPGQFSRRGGIIDILPNDRPDACRVEFFGDTVESIRIFDLETHATRSRFSNTLATTPSWR